LFFFFLLSPIALFLLFRIFLLISSFVAERKGYERDGHHSQRAFHPVEAMGNEEVLLPEKAAQVKDGFPSPKV
jgi:hypothetical protein